MARQAAVVGLGRFGFYTAARLVQNGCQVLGVDQDRAKAEAARDVLHRVVIADATDRQALEQLELGQMDAVIVSMGDRLDASVLATLHLKDMGVKNLVVKAMTEDHARILKKLGASNVVFPERDRAQRLADSITWPNVLDYIPLASDYSIMEMSPPAAIVGKTLKDSALRSRYGVDVLAVRELDPEKMIVFPGADFLVQKDHAIIVVGRNEALEELRSSTE